jgi:DNA-binding ferritin-like protein
MADTNPDDPFTTTQESTGRHNGSQPLLHQHGAEVAHEIVIEKVRDAITKTAANRDDGTNDLLMGDVLRTNEFHVWFVAEHLVDVPAILPVTP